MRSDLPNVLYASRDDGLGTRLCALGWSWRLARKLKAVTVFAWPPPPRQLADTLGLEFTPGELFDLASHCAGDGGDLHIVYGRFEPRDYPRLDAGPGWKSRSRSLDPAALFSASGFLAYGHYVPVLLQGEDLDEAGAECSRLLKSLPLHWRIEKTLADSLGDRSAGSGFDAYHFRRGDISTVLADNIAGLARDEAKGALVDAYLSYYVRKCTPRAVLMERLRGSVKAGRKFYLSSDDPQTVRDCKAIFGAAMIVPDTRRLTAPQKTLFDIAMMSRADVIVGSPSGFVRAAAVMADKPLTPYSCQDWPTAFEADLRDIADTAHGTEGDWARLVESLRANAFLARRSGAR